MCLKVDLLYKRFQRIMNGAFGARGCASATIEVEFESTNGSVKTTAN